MATSKRRPVKVSELFWRGDQRIDQALHAPNLLPIEALNNYLHRPRRTRREQIVRVPAPPSLATLRGNRVIARRSSFLFQRNRPV